MGIIVQGVFASYLQPRAGTLELTLYLIFIMFSVSYLEKCVTKWLIS
jgi:hypothetical protein